MTRNTRYYLETTDDDRQWRAAWDARIAASRTKSQRTQDRVLERFFAESRAREAVQRQAAAEKAIAEERADKAAYMREYRADKRAWRVEVEASSKGLSDA